MLPRSVTATLANAGRFWDHACRNKQIALSFDCVTLTPYIALAVVWNYAVKELAIGSCCMIKKRCLMNGNCPNSQFLKFKKIRASTRIWVNTRIVMLDNWVRAALKWPEKKWSRKKQLVNQWQGHGHPRLIDLHGDSIYNNFALSLLVELLFIALFLRNKHTHTQAHRSVLDRDYFPPYHYCIPVYT